MTTGSARLLDLAEYVAHFRARVLQDALSEAEAAYWIRRAEQFEAVGNARCDETARACRARARVAAMIEHDDVDGHHDGLYHDVVLRSAASGWWSP